MVADFRREYGYTSADLAGLDVTTFRLLMQGLSEHSRFLQAWQAAPKHIYDPADVAAYTAAARR